MLSVRKCYPAIKFLTRDVRGNIEDAVQVVFRIGDLSAPDSWFAEGPLTPGGECMLLVIIRFIPTFTSHLSLHVLTDWHCLPRVQGGASRNPVSEFRLLRRRWRPKRKMNSTSIWVELQASWSIGSLFLFTQISSLEARWTTASNFPSWLLYEACQTGARNSPKYGSLQNRYEVWS